MRRDVERLSCMLVRPPAGYGTGNKPNIREGLYLLPQALPCLARVIETKGAEPLILDFEVNRWSLADFTAEVKRKAPDIVFFTVTSLSFCYCREMARVIREIAPHVPIVFGGPHATYEWGNILNQGVADIVVLGEGEAAVPHILDYVVGTRALTECAGIAYRAESGMPVRTENLSTKRPLGGPDMPAYNYLDMQAYRERVGKCSIEVVRGCPHGCKFCLNTKYYPNMRYKPVEDVLKEVELLVGSYGFNKLSIISPELLADPSYISVLLNALEPMLRGTSATWACATTAMSLSTTMLKQMAKAHCRSIFIGIESAASQVQCAAGGKLQLSALEDRLLMVKDAGIDVLASFIIGLPCESEASARQTIDLALHLREAHTFIKTIQFNTFGPFPGTDFTEDLERYACRILPVDFAYYAIIPAIESEQFPRERHHALWYEVWKYFFPQYYEQYLEIERAALAGKNPRLASFCGDSLDPRSEQRR